MSDQRQYWFKDMDRHQMADLVDEEFPISLAEFGEKMITRVHSRYPMIDKPMLAMIVKAFFKTLRGLMIVGYRIHIDDFVGSIRLHFWLNRNKGPSVKAAVNKLEAMRRRSGRSRP